MKRRAMGKAVLLLISLLVLIVGIDTLVSGYKSNFPLALHILSQIVGWGFIAGCILGLVVVAALIKRDKSLF